MIFRTAIKAMAKPIGLGLLLALLQFGWVAHASAQTNPPQADTKQNPDVDPNYVLGPDDVLSILVRGVPDFSGDFRIGDDGYLSFPVVGQISAAGLKPRELQLALEKGLAKELRDPQVSVNVKQKRISRIYILGAVKQPSYYDYKKGWRLSELIAAGGGLILPPERVKAIVFRTGAETQKIELRKIFIDGDDTADIPLQQNDVVNIQSDVAVRVNIVGEVHNSGIHELLEGQGAVEALGAAGGSTQQAALSRSRISRKGQDIPVDLYGAVINGDSSKNVPIQDGDTLYVPQQYAHIGVVGTVNHPGAQVIPDGRPFTLSEAISEAGGAAARAKTNGVQLTRVGPDGKTITKTVDLKKLGTPDHPDMVLQDKDVIFVPQSGATDLNELGLIGNLYFIVRAFVTGR